MATKNRQNPATNLGEEDRITLERVAVGFARRLRTAGLVVPVSRTITYSRALDLVGLSSRERVYWAGRATLLGQREDVDVYDRVFSAYWLGVSTGVQPEKSEPVLLALDDVDSDGDSEPEVAPEPDSEALAVRYSAVESLREKDFAAYSEEDWANAHRLIASLARSAELCRNRRQRPARRRHGNLDIRRTVRRSMLTGGEPLVLARKLQTDQPRPVVLLVDVSGSMEMYARALLSFAHAVTWSNRSRKVEVFALGTRLTRITLELRTRDPNVALAAASSAVLDWSGGTRLGENIGRFNDQWGVRGVARGAMVIVLSDGWDRGDPALMTTEMERLSRVAHRVVWVNPLKALEGFVPVAQGMAAALPWVDDFVAGHSIDALEHLADVIANASGTKSAEKISQTLLASR